MEDREKSEERELLLLDVDCDTEERPVFVEEAVDEAFDGAIDGVLSEENEGSRIDIRFFLA